MDRRCADVDDAAASGVSGPTTTRSTALVTQNRSTAGGRRYRAPAFGLSASGIARGARNRVLSPAEKLRFSSQGVFATAGTEQKDTHELRPMRVFENRVGRTKPLLRKGSNQTPSFRTARHAADRPPPPPCDIPSVFCMRNPSSRFRVRSRRGHRNDSLTQDSALPKPPMLSCSVATWRAKGAATSGGWRPRGSGFLQRRLSSRRQNGLRQSLLWAPRLP